MFFKPTMFVGDGPIKPGPQVTCFTAASTDRSFWCLTLIASSKLYCVSLVKCKFSKEWQFDPKFKDWLARDSKWVMKAKCKLLCKIVWHLQHGAAVVSHMQGKKYSFLVTVTSAQRVTQRDSKSAYSVGDLLKRQLKNLIKVWNVVQMCLGWSYRILGVPKNILNRKWVLG